MSSNVDIASLDQQKDEAGDPAQDIYERALKLFVDAEYGWTRIGTSSVIHIV
jgi:hypothetical protein